MAEKKGVPVSFRADPELDAAFREACEMYATTRSQMMRRLYEAFAREVKKNGMVIPDQWVADLVGTADGRAIRAAEDSGNYGTRAKTKPKRKAKPKGKRGK